MAHGDTRGRLVDGSSGRIAKKFLVSGRAMYFKEVTRARQSTRTLRRLRDIPRFSGGYVHHIADYGLDIICIREFSSFRSILPALSFLNQLRFQYA